MSGSKLLRLCSLFLCLLLFLANFSVVANAAEDEENLIDSDLLTWNDLSSIYPDIEPFQVFRLAKTGNVQYYQIGWNQPQNATLLSSNAIYTLPNLYVGDTYTLKLSVNATQEISLTDATWFIGIGYIDPSTNEPIAYDDNYIILTTENMQGAIGYYYITNYYKEITFKYTHKENLGQPCIFIQGTLIDNSVSSSSVSINILYNSVSLTRDPSETEKKLDGILGWLQDIKNTLTGLPELIKTNLSTFFTDLSTKLTELKNNIKTNLETLGNNINGKLGDVSTDFSDYVSGLGDRVSSFFSDLKTNLTSEFTAFKNKVNTEFTNLKSNLTTNFDNLRSTLSSRFDKVDNFLTEIRDFFHNLYWDLVGGTCGAGDVHSSLFERLGDRIRGFFEDLKVKIDIKVEEIKNAIHDFFVPPEGFFEEWKANFDLMLSENLGFIYETPDLITGFVTLAKNILDTDTEPSIIFPEISFELPGEYGGEINLFEETEVDLSFLSEFDVFSFLYYEAYPALLHVIFILALTGYAKYIWGRTMSN